MKLASGHTVGAVAAVNAVGRVTVLIGGALALATALLMAPQGEAATIMERAVTVAAILSGGMLGLFFLGFFTRTATRRGERSARRRIPGRLRRSEPPGTGRKLSE